MRAALVITIADRVDPGPGSAPRYAEIRARARAAEAGGWDALWLYDHLLYRDEGGPTFGIWESWTLLSALAEATQTVGIGVLVACTQFRNPAILAKMAATLDEVSGGRFTLGLGAGWNRAEFEAFGIPWDHRVTRFEEAIRIIAPLLREGRTDFQGTYYQARDCLISPRGPRPNGPPILVGTNGPRMLELTARYADAWNCGYLGRPDELDERLAGLQAACARVGRDPSTIQVTAELLVWYPDLAPPPRVDQYLDTSLQELAEALSGFQARGVAELMVRLIPPTEEAFLRTTSALHAHRRPSSPTPNAHR